MYFLHYMALYGGILKKRIFFSLFLLLPMMGRCYEFSGKHFTASLVGCDNEALTDVSKLREAMLEAVALTGATVLDVCDYTFSGNGFTMVILLSESHASIHTYPEVSSCFVDLFTCGERCRHDPFEERLVEFLQPKKIEAKTICR